MALFYIHSPVRFAHAQALRDFQRPRANACNRALVYFSGPCQGPYCLFYLWEEVT